jgi:hypothetical protein
MRGLHTQRTGEDNESGDGEQSIAEMAEFEINGNKIGKAELNSKKQIWLIGDQQRNTSLRHGATGNDRNMPVLLEEAGKVLGRATSRGCGSASVHRSDGVWTRGRAWGAQWMRRARSTAEGDCLAFQGVVLGFVEI